MWKWLRNLLLAGLLLAGTLKLLAWYEAGQDAQRLSALLGPSLQLTYGSVSAGLDGSVALHDAALTVKGEHGGTFKADRVVLETPNVLWVVKHALLGEDTWPSRFGVTVQGFKLPAGMKADPHWFDPLTLVPFETAGCAAAQFSPADFRRMDVSAVETPPLQHADFHYDAETKELDATLLLTAPETANLTVSADLHGFDGAALRSLDGLRRMHIGRLGVDFADNGFLKRRNQFCAQRGNVPATQFIEQHLSAVQSQLQQQGIEAGADVLKLYRRLVEGGGRLSVLSLPSAGVTGASLAGAPNEDLLRQLNVTARYADTPPVMFRLTFLAPPEAPETAVASDAAGAPAAPAAGSAAAPGVTATANPAPAPGPAGAAPTAAPAAAASPLAGTGVANTPPSAAKPPPVATTTPAPPPPATKPAPVTAGSAPVVVTATPPAGAAAAKPALAMARPTTTGNGLEEFDKAAAKLALASPPAPLRSPASAASPAPAGSATAAGQAAPGPDVAPSSTPPPSGSSALALVWKPTFERLPPPPPERRDFDAIDFAGLRNQTGRFVRLITESGKKVEGYVVSADDNEVDLRIKEGGGSAHFVVQKAHVQQVLVARAGQPPA